MANNIIFILFLILLILIILWLGTAKKEGFDNTTTPGNFSGTVDATTPASEFINYGNTTPGSVSGGVSSGVGGTTPGSFGGVGGTTPGSFGGVGGTTPGSRGGGNGGTTTPGASSGSNTTPGAGGGTTTPGAAGGTLPDEIIGPDTGIASDCQYSWSDWGKCDLTTGKISRKVNMISAQHGGAACTTPPTNAVSIACLNTLNFAYNLKGWSILFDPNDIRSSKNYYVSIFNPRMKKRDIFGFSQSTVFNTNYVRVRFDNTNNAYSNYDKVTLALQTTIPKLSAGNYLLSYYVQSRVSDMDAQSVAIYVAAVETSNTPLMFRTEDNQSLIKPGVWVKQTLAFQVQPSDPEDTRIQLVFQLFDTQTAADNIVAIGGIQLQSCGNAPCNIDCTYIYGDWSYCEFPSGESKRTVYTIPPVNQGAACTRESPEITRQNCLSSIHFTDSDLIKSGWALTYNPASITSYANTIVTTAAEDKKFAFDSRDAQFSTPYTIINFDNTNGNLSSFTNPKILMQTSMKLAPGNYRMTYFLQSWNSKTDSQSIWVNGLFGTTRSPTFNSKGTVVPGVWFPMAMEFTVDENSKQPIPIQFQFTLKDRTKGMNHAVAIGGIDLVSCGQDNCPIDCQYVWDYWTPCDKQTNTTYRDALVLVDANNNGVQCPMRQTNSCSVTP